MDNISPGHICAVSVFQLKKFSFCFPCLLSLLAERDCKFTVADGTFSETQLCRPIEHRVESKTKSALKFHFKGTVFKCSNIA